MCPFYDMKPTLFKTSNGNRYIYSPKNKTFLPLSEQVYKEIIECKEPHSKEYNILLRYGYLDNFIPKYHCHVLASDIKHSLSNIPQVIFEVTSACNLRCEYCCYGHGYETFKNRKHGNLSFESAKKILHYLVKLSKGDFNSSYNTPFVISFYGGEPLLNIDVIKKIVEYSKTLDFNGRILRFSMTTNATHLAENIDFLKKNDFSLLVSLDGDKTANQHRKLPNGDNSFDEIMRNLNIIRAKYPDYFSTIRYNSVYTDVSDTQNLLDFFKKELNTSPTINALHEPDVNAPEYEAIQKMLKKISQPSSVNEISDFLQIPLQRRIIDIIHKLSKNYQHSESDYFEPEQIDSYPTGTCVPFSKRLFVTTDGAILPCEKICRDNPLGIIDSEGVHIDEQVIADSFNQSLNETINQCSQCYMQQCCNQCIHNFKKGHCNSFMNQTRFATILSEAFSYIELHPDTINILEENTILR